MLGLLDRTQSRISQSEIRGRKKRPGHMGKFSWISGFSFNNLFSVWGKELACAYLPGKGRAVDGVRGGDTE